MPGIAVLASGSGGLAAYVRNEKADSKPIRAGQLYKFAINKGETLTVVNPGSSTSVKVTNISDSVLMMGEESVPAGKSVRVKAKNRLTITA